MKKIVILLLPLLILTSCYKHKEEHFDDDNDIEQKTESFDQAPEEENELGLIIELGEGECIYDPGSNYGYRYGPSMLINDDGSIDAWFSRPGNSSTMWDYISYRHRYPDGGWSDEEIVLYPTEGTLDHYSVCDPGVIYFDGYYYLGYTSTINPDGMQNQIFVARSSEPNGYFEKWNGTGWGGDPQPIITYDGTGWGVGEISFVVKNKSLFCYYSYKDESLNTMNCSEALVSEDWPSTIKFRCICSNKEPEQCSCDVLYMDGIYYAFSIGNRMMEDSYLKIEYSKDGREFEELEKVYDIKSGAHNLGITKHANGHINLDDELYISYAYSNDDVWGRWKTYFQKISIK